MTKRFTQRLLKRFQGKKSHVKDLSVNRVKDPSDSLH